MIKDDMNIRVWPSPKPVTPFKDDDDALITGVIVKHDKNQDAIQLLEHNHKIIIQVWLLHETYSRPVTVESLEMHCTAVCINIHATLPRFGAKSLQRCCCGDPAETSFPRSRITTLLAFVEINRYNISLLGTKNMNITWGTVRWIWKILGGCCISSVDGQDVVL